MTRKFTRREVFRISGAAATGAVLVACGGPAAEEPAAEAEAPDRGR